MKSFKLALLATAAAALAACGSDEGPTTPDKVPMGFTRFVNAVSDTGAMDWRFVDVIENSPTAFGLNFRQTFPGAGYQATGAGSRHLRLFQTSTDIAVTSKILIDTTFTVAEGQHYTLLAAGSMRAGTAKLYIITDNYPDPGTSVAVRALNAGVAASADVYASASGGTSPLPATPAIASVAQFTASNWTTLATGPLALRVTASGSKTVMVDGTAPAGLPADKPNNLSAVGGSTIAGSAFTAIYFPTAVAGSPSSRSAACTTAAPCTAAGVVYIVDKYPPTGL
jgi:hypothetical protein